MALKPSLKMHEVIDNSYHYAIMVHCGSQNSCHAYIAAQPAKKRQSLTVRVAKR